ncbi:Vegetative incompatibility protein [Paramyrothecium foliicola]|nr:Vegetative incompatibility protein [Paramyrothecium foliicola]
MDPLVDQRLDPRIGHGLCLSPAHLLSLALANNKHTMGQLPSGAEGAAAGVLTYSFVCLGASCIMVWLTWHHRERTSYVAFLSYFTLLSTLCSIIQQIHSLVRWRAIIEGQFNNLKTNAGNPELIISNSSVGLDLVLFYIQYYSYTVESFLVMFWGWALVQSVYQLSSNPKLKLPLKIVNRAGIGFSIGFPLITISSLQLKAVRANTQVFMLLAKQPLFWSLGLGALSLILVFGRYLHSRRQVNRLPFMQVEASASTSGSQQSHKRRSMYDQWLLIRFTIAFFLMGGFALSIAAFSATSAERIAEEGQKPAPDFSAERARSTYISYMPGVTASLLVFIVFATTKPCIEYMKSCLFARAAHPTARPEIPELPVEPASRISKPRISYHRSDAPTYATLSHTWGEGEVSFQDMLSGRGRSMPGFSKIKAACSEAARQNINWVWVDTCCIDKTSSAELSEAINSMYDWYQKSSVCFAYMSGVDCPLRDLDDHACDLLSCEQLSTSFRWAKWFSRGWTLQELIAPKNVEFFSQEWKSLGSKRASAPLISDITGISEIVLLGNEHVSSCSIAMRMSWAAGRVCTRIEDTAYCLFGLFDINMPLLYGEGNKAFFRLQEEILRSSNDLSLLVWSSSGDSVGRTSYSSVLAESPANFVYSYRLQAIPERRDPANFTKLGLHIKMELIPTSSRPWHLGHLRYFQQPGRRPVIFDVIMRQPSTGIRFLAFRVMRVHVNAVEYGRNEPEIPHFVRLSVSGKEFLEPRPVKEVAKPLQEIFIRKTLSREDKIAFSGGVHLLNARLHPSLGGITSTEAECTIKSITRLELGTFRTSVFTVVRSGGRRWQWSSDYCCLLSSSILPEFAQPIESDALVFSLEHAYTPSVFLILRSWGDTDPTISLHSTFPHDEAKIEELEDQASSTKPSVAKLQVGPLLLMMTLIKDPRWRHHHVLFFRYQCDDQKRSSSILNSIPRGGQEFRITV